MHVEAVGLVAHGTDEKVPRGQHIADVGREPEKAHVSWRIQALCFTLPRRRAPPPAGDDQPRIPRPRSRQAAPGPPQQIESLVDVVAERTDEQHDRNVRRHTECVTGGDALRAGRHAPRGIGPEIDRVRARPRHADKVNRRPARGIGVGDHDARGPQGGALARDGNPLQAPGSVPGPPRRAVIAHGPRCVHGMQPVDVGPDAVSAVDDDARIGVAGEDGARHRRTRAREQPLGERRRAARPRDLVPAGEPVCSEPLIDLVADEMHVMAEVEETGRERGIRPVHPAVLMEAAGHDDPRNAFSLCGHSSLPVAPRRWAPCSPPLEQMRLRARRSSRSAAAESPWTAPT